MSQRAPIPLSPVTVGFHCAEIESIRTWSFAENYILRLLTDDIPRRMKFGFCRIWTYFDPDKNLVGFGTLDVCEDYRDRTEGKPHLYVPLLAVNPGMEGRGHGTRIFQHLMEEAAIMKCRWEALHELLFLDVYTDNRRAISLYSKSSFVQLSPDPIPDPMEGGREYIIMARRIAFPS